MMKFIPILFSFLVVPLLVGANDSQYSTMDHKICKMIESSDDDPDAQIDYFTMVCPGRDGYKIKISGGDLRSHVIVMKGRKEIFDSRIDVYNHAPGGFPYVAGNVLEWRYGADKKLRAIIFRIAGQDYSKDPLTNPKDVSTLMVFQFKDGKFCYVGKDVSNEGARKLADSDAKCVIK